MSRSRRRIYGLLLPPDKAEEVRQRARPEQGASVTAEPLETAPYVVVFTTIPFATIKAQRVYLGRSEQFGLHATRSDVTVTTRDSEEPLDDQGRTRGIGSLAARVLPPAFFTCIHLFGDKYEMCDTSTFVYPVARLLPPNSKSGRFRIL